MYRDLIRNIAWLSGASAAVKPVWFLFITALCMRYLGVENYGRFMSALAIGAMASSLTDFGAVRYSVREIAANPTHASLLFSNLFTFRVAVSMLVLAVTITVGYALGYVQVALLSLAFATVYHLALSTTNYCRGLYRAFERLKTEGLSLIAEKTLVVGLGTAALLTFGRVESVLGAMACAMVAVAIMNLSIVHWLFADFAPRNVSIGYLKSVIPSMLPLGLAGVLTVAYLRVDIVMIDFLVGNVPTGQYGAAFRILEASLLLPSVVSIAALYPRFSRLFAQGSIDDYRKLLLRSLVWLPLLGLGVTVAVFFAAPLIIRLLAPGPDFAPAGDVLRVLFWTFPFLCANNVLVSALISIRQEWRLAAALVVAAIFNVALNLAIIPRYGAIGAAATTIASEVLLLALCGWMYARSTNRRDNSTDERGGSWTDSVTALKESSSSADVAN